MNLKTDGNAVRIVCADNTEKQKVQSVLGMPALAAGEPLFQAEKVFSGKPHEQLIYMDKFGRLWELLTPPSK